MSAPTVAEVLPLPDGGALDLAANAFVPAAQALISAVAAVDATWQGLGAPGVYETDSTAEVLGAMRGPKAMADIVRTQCADVRGILSTYASNLQSLAPVRAQLIADLGAQTTSESKVEIGTAASTQRRLEQEATADASLRQRVDAFNAAALKADGDCAATLRSIEAFPLETLKQIAESVENNTGKDIETLKAAAERVRRPPRLAIGEEDPEGMPDGMRPRYMWGEEQYLADRLRPDVLDPIGSIPRSERGIEFSFVPGSDDFEGGIIPWMKVAGHALGVVGAGLTLLSVWGERDEELTADHPDWSFWQRFWEDGQTTVIVGGSEVAGSMLGSLAGEAAVPEEVLAPAAVGTLAGPEGTVAGAAVGVVAGIVTSIIGGIAGGGLGEAFGRSIDAHREEQAEKDGDAAAARDLRASRYGRTWQPVTQ